MQITRTPLSGVSVTHRLDVKLLLADVKPGSLTGSIVIETNDQQYPRLVVPVTGEFY